MATARQIAANRLNAQKSTGPTSEEGKAVSRGNALKHGMAGDGVVLTRDDAALVAERMETWRDSFRPAGDEEEWLFEKMIVGSVRVDRCQNDEREVRNLLAARAALCWDDDRALDAEELGHTISKKPALVAQRLRQTKQGCDWLLGRWTQLGAVLDRGGKWTEAQNALALDLLGTPHELRSGPVGSPREVVTHEVAGLERLRAGRVDDIDRFERESAGRGSPVALPRPLALLRRYEAAALRLYQWARNRLRSCRRPAATEPPAAVPDSPPPPPRPQMTEYDWRAYERSVYLRTSGTSGIPLPTIPEALVEPPAPEPAAPRPGL